MYFRFCFGCDGKREGEIAQTDWEYKFITFIVSHVQKCKTGKKSAFQDSSNVAV